MDSGAYYSIFLPEWARRLGIQIRSGQREQVMVGNGQTISIYLHRLGMRTGDEHFSAMIGSRRSWALASTCWGGLRSLGS